MSNTTVSFSDGRISGQNFLAMKRQTISVVCRFDRVQSVEYDFSLQKYLKEYDATAFTSGGLQFRLDAFSDSERKMALAVDTLYTGTPVYLSLSAVVAPELHSKLTFAPTRCVFKKTGVADQNFTLFEYNQNNCGQSFEEMEFEIDFRKNDRTWDISYKLFTFGENVASSYSLQCDVISCYTTDGMEPCRLVAETCDRDYTDNFNIWSPYN